MMLFLLAMVLVIDPGAPGRMHGRHGGEPLGETIAGVTPLTGASTARVPSGSALYAAVKTDLSKVSVPVLVLWMPYFAADFAADGAGDGLDHARGQVLDRRVGREGTGAGARAVGVQGALCGVRRRWRPAPRWPRRRATDTEVATASWSLATLTVEVTPALATVKVSPGETSLNVLRRRRDVEARRWPTRRGCWRSDPAGRRWCRRGRPGPVTVKADASPVVALDSCSLYWPGEVCTAAARTPGAGRVDGVDDRLQRAVGRA